MVFNVSFFTDKSPLQTTSGETYYWRFQPGSRNSPGTTEVSIDLDLPFDFTLSKEALGTKMAKWLGFASEYQTNDTAFDDLVYIDCDYMPFCETLRDSPQLRQAVTQLLTIQADYITAGKGRLTAKLIIPAPRPEQCEIDTIVSMLVAIKQLLAKAAGSYVDCVRPRFTRARIANMLITTLFVLGFVGVFLNLMQPDHIVRISRFCTMAAGCAVGVNLLALAAIAWVFNGSPRGYDVLASFLALGIIGVTFCTGDVLYNINIHLDASAATVYEQQVNNKYIQHGSRGGTSYHVRVEDWHYPDITYDLTVNRNFYTHVQQGTDRVRILSHPGFLNMEWIERYNLISQGH